MPPQILVNVKVVIHWIVMLMNIFSWSMRKGV